jgi:hypothetical protein
VTGQRTFEVGDVRVDKLGGEFRLFFEDEEQPGRVWFHALTSDQAADLALAICDLLADAKPAPLAAAHALATHPARVRERELPALRERRPELLAAWVAKHGGDAA